ncbi:MAG: prepilin-type N-terminal cleavage/methylation domain-containing protein [Gemmatimonadota bacterium]|nr:prepilin-type N-terminal cleavage/methylation domain-containing protein [Gemmatimonadota bacterium]
MTRDRRGFTLVELIVVSVLGVVVLTAMLQVLITNQRTYTAQSAVVEGQQSTRMALEVLFNELREASPAGGDLLVMTSDSVKVRLMRKFGIGCDTDLDALLPKMTVLDNSGADFAEDDSVFVFAENRDATPDDDVWISAEVTAVDTTVTCLGGRPAIDLEFDLQETLFSTDTVKVGAAVRSFETFTFGMTTVLGDEYLGRRDDDGFMWPIAGPLRPNDGLEFIYRDALGDVTSTPTDVRQIEVRIRTGTQVINPVGETVSDSIDAWIYTRN